MKLDKFSIIDRPARFVDEDRAQRAKDRDTVRQIIRRYGPNFLERLGIGHKVPVTQQDSLQKSDVKRTLVRRMKRLGFTRAEVWAKVQRTVNGEGWTESEKATALADWQRACDAVFTSKKKAART